MAEIDKDEVIEGITYTIDGSGPDGRVKTGDDLKEEVLETLGTYIHANSKDGVNGNKYQISPGVQKKSLRDDNGNPAPIDDVLAGSSNPYAATVDTFQLQRYSNSGKFATLGDFLEKGKSDNFIKDLPQGYTERSGRFKPISEPEGPVFDSINTLLDGNRFSPGVKGGFTSPENVELIDNSLGRVDFDNGREIKVLGTSQTTFGRYIPNEEAAEGAKNINMTDLKKVGQSLMYRAAIEIPPVQEGDPSNPLVSLGALLIPGAAQIGLLKVNTSNLQAGNVLSDNFDVPRSRLELDDLANQSSRSWGHLNTPTEPYGGFLPIGMTLIAILMIIALKLLALGFIALLSLMAGLKLQKIPHRGPFIAGEYGKPRPAGTLFSISMIGIRDTERDFFTVVNQGLDIIFEFDGTSFRRVVREPQTYAIMVRNIIRSGNVIVNAIRDAFNAGGSPLSAESQQATLGLIDVLRSSKIIGFLNILALMGDRAAELQDQGFDEKSRKVSSLENLPTNNPAANVMKIRESRSLLRSGMRTSATLSKFIFPIEALRAGKLVAGGAVLSNIEKGLSAMPIEHVAIADEFESNNRLSKEAVSKMENYLDSEYVPFYFHDLRTNEIISFHAFLSSLEDSYSPKYEDTSAYGRIDSVKTYSSTERTVNLSFNIVATSKDDFDYMYWKVNKLVSMVYPGWSSGRKVNAGDSNFIQPFSQIPTDTPLIRMRIGDFIRSNYSKFGLQRLFGIGNEGVDLIEDTTNSADLENLKQKILETRKRMITNPAVSEDDKVGYFIGEKATLLPNRQGYKENVTPISLVKDRLNPSSKKRLVTTISHKVAIAPPLGPAPAVATPVPGAIIEDYGEHKTAYYIVEIDEPDISDELKGQFIVTHDDLLPDQDSVLETAFGGFAALLGAQAAATAEITMRELFGEKDPFSSDENVIVKSFETTQGKGLAGVITSLNFTDLAATNVTWETSDFGSRAPKVLKVNISFAVTHDIAPGLDSSGFMRAINYPVGRVAGAISGDSYEEDNNAEEDFKQNHLRISEGLRNPNKKSGGGKFTL